MIGPVVSIVIDNFNYGRFVGAAIASALDQTYPNVEVIVVDDGSTDESVAIIASFGDRVTAILQPNRGQSTAFNTGILAARGEIVLFLDSDDALHPDAVTEVVAAWRPGVAKVQFCLASVDANGAFLGNIFPNFPSGLTGEAVRDEVLRTGLYPCPPTSGNAYASWFLAETVPLPPIICGADGPLNTVAPLYGDVVTIDKPLGFYRVHGDNDGAQGELETGKFGRFIRHDQNRINFLRAHAARCGQTVIGEPLDRAVLNLQYRMASLKLKPEDHPIPGETPGRIVRHAAAALRRARERPSARLFLILWFVAVAVAPRRLARWLIALRFVPKSRPERLVRAMRRLRVLRGRAGTDPTDLSLPAPLRS
jgi:hypothetical protein